MKKRINILWFVLLIGISLFVCIFTFFVLSNNQSYSITTLLLNISFNIPTCLIMSFIDYKVIDSFQNKFSKQKIIQPIIIDITLTSLLIGALSIGANFVLSLFLSHKFDILRLLMPAILWNSIIVLIIELFFYHQRQVENEIKLNMIQKEKAIYQFEALKNQINPHFLFNSLNVLSSLAYQDVKKTNLFAKNLSNVYRYLLTTHERQTVTLKEELLFVDSYLYLEQIRFGDTLQIIIENDERYQNRNIIPASVQILVENAIKHNISTSKSPLVIHILVNDNGVVVSNNLQPRSYVIKNEIGLKNLKKQYSLYYKKIICKKTATDFIVEIPFIE